MTFDEWWENYFSGNLRNFRIDLRVLRDAFEAGKKAGTPDRFTPDPLPAKKQQQQQYHYPYVVECTGCGEQVELDADEHISVQLTQLASWTFDTVAGWHCPNCACRGPQSG